MTQSEAISEDKMLEASIDTVQDILKKCSLIRWKNFTQCADFQQFDLGEKEKNLVFDHWMSLILVSGPSLRVMYKVHFNSQTTKRVAAHNYGKDPDKITDSQAADFIKEYSNITAGYLKAIFEENKLNVGISLPLVIRGFDEVFFSVINPKVSRVDHWKMLFSDFSFICSSYVEIFDAASLSSLSYKFDQDEDSEDDGEIDFL